MTLEAIDGLYKALYLSFKFPFISYLSIKSVYLKLSVVSIFSSWQSLKNCLSSLKYLCHSCFEFEFFESFPNNLYYDYKVSII